MAKKKKQKRLSQTQQLEIAHRELEKGNAKQALKHAKACYRLDPSEPVRSLLQRAILSRGRELHTHAQFEPARAVMKELDETGEVGAEYQSDANRLRVLLGLHGDQSSELLNDKGMRDELADQAVLLGSAASRHSNTTEAENIRAALSATEQGQFERAAELVAPIGRDSAYCDWKLLVRGLSAYYENDMPRMSANWSRLADDRPARRIADTLSLLQEPDRNAEASGDTRARLDRLTRSLESPLIGSLRGLRLNDKRVHAELRRFMTLHAKAEPDIAVRVANIFIQDAIKNEDCAGLTAMKRFLPKLPLDPHLNRAFALLAEKEGDLTELEKYWNAYIVDLKSCESLGESQRVLATALIYCRIAIQYMIEIDEAEEAAGFMYSDDEEIEELERDAISYFRKSIEVNPDSANVHLALGRFLDNRDRPKEAADVFREIGRRFPDDADSLLAAASHFVVDEPDVAKAYAKKAGELRPRDRDVAVLLWSASLALARKAAKLRQFRLAEAELDEAETLLNAGDFNAYLLYSLRAAIAFKEGNLEAAERHLNQTIQQFEQPTAALLLVDSQTQRCGVDTKLTKDVRSRLTKALKGRANSQAAGVMSKYLHAIMTRDLNYSGLAAHTKQVDAYLNRCSRVKWQADHLIEACRFASLEKSRLKLFEKLAKRGIDLFPQNPYFHYFTGLARMAVGPTLCDYDAAQDAFERAIALDKQGDIKLEESYCQSASRSLSLLDAGPPSNPFDFDGELDDDEDPFADIPAELRNDLINQALETMPPELMKAIDDEGLNPHDVIRAVLAKVAKGRM